MAKKFKFPVNIKNVDVDVRNYVESRLLNVELDMKEVFQGYLNDFFKNDAFISKLKGFFKDYVDAELRVELSKKGFKQKITSEIRQSVSDIMNSLDKKEMISITIEKVFEKQKDMLETELVRTKGLVYSIDSEISHLSQRTGLSVQTDVIVKNKLNELNRNMLLLENGKSNQV